MLQISYQPVRALLTSLAMQLLLNGTAFAQSASSQSARDQSLSDSSLSTQTSSSQSLADIARENQAKKAAEDPTANPPKVIRNSDLPRNPDGYTAPPVGQTSTTQAHSATDNRAAVQSAAEQRGAEKWKRNIQSQENIVFNLQARADRLRAQIHLADPNNSYAGDPSNYAGMGYNGYQLRQMERLHQMEDQLRFQKLKLEQMQEAARHLGMHTTIYDP
jgi:hypothetical protein